MHQFFIKIHRCTKKEYIFLDSRRNHRHNLDLMFVENISNMVKCYKTRNIVEYLKQIEQITIKHRFSNFNKSNIRVILRLNKFRMKEINN